MEKFAQLTLVFVILMIATACRQQTLSVENINLDVTVTDSLVGETELIIKVTDGDENAIENPGKLSIRGDMDHAGMAPVLRDAEESINGIFTVPFEWTMGGSWSLEVQLTLENGEVATETFSYEILTEASEDDMAGMDMGSSETSAVYMTISNNGDDTVTIVGVETDAAGLIEIHETTVEDDVARMSPIEAITIDAGDTVELRPGGMHIMIMQLTQDIIADEELELSLNLESGDTITVNAVVLDMLMDDLEGTVSVGDLEFSNVWARPASAGMAMDADDMDATEEADD